MYIDDDNEGRTYDVDEGLSIQRRHKRQLRFFSFALNRFQISKGTKLSRTFLQEKFLRLCNQLINRTN